jgi:hypothetical protein
VISTRASLIGIAAVLSLALSGCASGGNEEAAPTQTPTPAPTPTPTVTVPALTPEQAWDSFVEISEASCQAAYGGLVEEDLFGPNLGKLKIQLTYEQAGENSMVFSHPNGQVGPLWWSQFFACETKAFFGSMTYNGLNYPEDPGYSPNWPIQITFDPQTSKFQTVRLTEEGNQKTLIFEVLDGKFTNVEEVEIGSKTKITYGLPGAAETQIVTNYYESIYGSEE